MPKLTRREATKLLGAATMAAGFTWTRAEIDDAWAAVGVARRRAHGQAFEPRFFTPDEWWKLHVLVDLIIPRDRRSGSATDAGVPEFIDFVVSERENEARQVAMRGGLAWLDTECRERFGKESFLAATEAERTRLLDAIAYPERAAPEVNHGVQFFNSLRNLTASGFWSSKMGVADLQYMGNVAVGEWTGCPEEQLRKLGLQP
jgi:gluconate 2-dehydrogenase gamma chain